jgi:hypothetical protein
MSEQVPFYCKCGGRILEEIMVDAIISSEFRVVDVPHEEDEDIRPAYFNETNQDGRVDHYQCGACGMVLKMPQEAPDGITVDNPVLLVQWLKQYGQRKEDNANQTKDAVPDVPKRPGSGSRR